MKYIGFTLLGLLLLIAGLLVESSVLGILFIAITKPLGLLIVVTCIFSIVIGNCIRKYGFSGRED